MSWCDLDLNFDLTEVTLTCKILSVLYLGNRNLSLDTETTSVFTPQPLRCPDGRAGSRKKFDRAVSQKP